MSHPAPQPGSREGDETAPRRPGSASPWAHLGTWGTNAHSRSFTETLPLPPDGGLKLRASGPNPVGDRRVEPPNQAGPIEMLSGPLAPPTVGPIEKALRAKISAAVKSTPRPRGRSM